MPRVAGDPAAAEPLMREYHSIMTEVLDERHVGHINGKEWLGDCRWQQGEFASADSYYVEALTVCREHHPKGTSALQLMPAKVARNRQALGDDAVADAIIREALAWAREVYGDRDPEVARVLGCFASDYHADGCDERVAAQREALSIDRSLHSGDDSKIAMQMIQLARCLTERGDRDRRDDEAADVLLRDAQGTLHRLHGDEVPWQDHEVLLRRWWLMPLKQGRADEAEPMLRQAVEIARGNSEEDAMHKAWAESAYGARPTALGRYAEAESLLVGSHELLRVRVPRTSPVQRVRGGLRPTVERLIDLYGRLGEAKRVREFEEELRAIDASPKRNE